MSPIAERVRDARLLRGMTKAQLASASGLSSSYLAQLENPGAGATIKEPGATKLSALASALDVPLEWLASGAGPAPKGMVKPKPRRAS